METQEYKLINKTIEAIFNYLIAQPYKDVAGIIEQMQMDLQNNNKPIENEERLI